MLRLTLGLLLLITSKASESTTNGTLRAIGDARPEVADLATRLTSLA